MHASVLVWAVLMPEAAQTETETKQGSTWSGEREEKRNIMIRKSSEAKFDLDLLFRI